MIDLSVNKESLKHNIENARKNNVILPTYEEMKDPGKIPAKIQEKLKKTCSVSHGRMSRRRQADSSRASRITSNFRQV